MFEHCKSFKLSFLAGEILEVGRQTRKQSLSKTWYDQRAGRITASIMHSEVHTSLCSPSLSLVKAICYLEVFSFSSPATDWGRTYEQFALKRYLSNEMAHHDSLSVSASALFLNETWPFLGASPDGIVNCSCCGKGLVEIKCPYKHRRSTITSAIDDLQFCLALVNGKVALKRSHLYFYQNQTQLHVRKVDFCGFCVCLFHPDKADDFFIERNFPDNSFWDVCVQKSSLFFQEVLLLEWLENGIHRQATA